MHETKRTLRNQPADWPVQRVGDFAERITTRNRERCGNVLTISAEHGLVSQADFFNRRVASDDLRPYIVLERGDFAYNRSYSKGYPFGAFRRLEDYQKGVVSPLYLCFRPALARVSSEFLTHYFDAGVLDEGLGLIAKEGVRNHGLLNVGTADFFELPLKLPPLPEQRQIAAILDTLDDAIRKTEQIIAKLKQVKQGLLHDLLTRGIDDNGELRDPDRHPEQFKESALGRIPKGWEVLPIGELLAPVDPAMRSGPFGSALLKSELVETGVPLLGIDNVHVEHFEPTYTRFVTPKKAQHLGRYLVRPCDVMITIMGTVGRCCVVPPEMGAALSTKHVWTLTFDTQRYDPDLACVQINHAPWVLRHFARDEQGGIMSAIRSETLRTTILPVPPPSELGFIARVLKEISSRIAIETTMVAKRKLQKAGLMEDLLTGRVRVTSLVDCLPAELPT